MRKLQSTNFNQEGFNSDISSHFAVEAEILSHPREDSKKLGLLEINITPEEGRLMQYLVFASGTIKDVENGTLGCAVVSGSLGDCNPVKGGHN